MILILTVPDPSNIEGIDCEIVFTLEGFEFAKVTVSSCTLLDEDMTL